MPRIGEEQKRPLSHFGSRLLAVLTLWVMPTGPSLGVTLTPVRLRRRRELADMLRAYKVLVDGEQVGKVRRGRVLEFELAPGRHRLWLRLDWGQSNTLDVDANGAPVELECGSRFAGWRALRGVNAILGEGGEYLWLNRVPARTAADPAASPSTD